MPLILIQAALSTALAIVFASVALTKANKFAHFVQIVEQYHIAPTSFAKPMAIAVIAAEVALSAGLLVPATRERAAWFGVLLLLLFIAAMSSVLLRGRQGVDCGCSLVSGSSQVGSASLARNVGLTAALVGVALFRVSGVAPENSELLYASAGGVAVAFLYLAIETLSSFPHNTSRGRL